MAEEKQSCDWRSRTSLHRHRWYSKLLIKIRDLPFSLAYGIFIAMKRVLTVDRAGRIVLPKQLREQFNLHPGSQLEIALGPDRVELKPAETGMMLRRKRKLWVHHGRAQTSLDRAVTNLREERLRSVGRASQS